MPKPNDKKSTPVVEIKANEVKEQLAKVKFDIEGKMLHIKVGDAERPANGDDVKEIEKDVKGILDEYDINCVVFVTHHAVEVKIIG